MPAGHDRNHARTGLTNGVDLTFVGGAHIGCKSLYVLADSDYNTTADLKGHLDLRPKRHRQASDYNITCAPARRRRHRLLRRTDVNLVQVTADACVAAMENGEIAAALLSAIPLHTLMVTGRQAQVHPLPAGRATSQTRTCCVMAMNGTFVKENPTIAKKVAQAVQKAHSWMRDNSDEATKVLMDMGWNGGNYEMNIMINNSLQFGLSDEFTGETLKDFIGRYIRLGLITSMDNADEVLKLAWSPIL